MAGAEDHAAATPLGKQTEYVSVYTPSLLCPIPRSESRELIEVSSDQLPFTGVDIWTGYELSWIDTKGKPKVAIGHFHFPCSTPSIVESKSFKLYLNSFNQTQFTDLNDVIKTLESDLTTTAGGPVMVDVQLVDKSAQYLIGRFAAENIDNLDIDIDTYKVNPELLTINDRVPMVRESLCSDLLKTNCPVTGQPDWASVLISYRGCPIDRAGLLRYIVSFRAHQDFHENCVERIFVDILDHCKPEELTVSARYTRRGGLDINPYRTNTTDKPNDVRLVRQ
ncbi:MAG: NADPH-dependent 7-cyano-7-deazaguanine reductase QueF [Cellvibrionaceae bacterium]